MRNSLLPVFTFAKIDIRRLFRDKTGIFFIFVFPLIFLFVFGTLYGDNQDISFSIAVINESESEFATSFEQRLRDQEIFSVQEDGITYDSALEQMNRGGLDAIVRLPEGFGVINPDKGFPEGDLNVLYSRENEQAGATLGSIFESIFADINAEFVSTDTPFTVSLEASEIEGLSTFDYVFSGLLGFTILSLGVFGPTTVFPRMKEKGILRRYHTTPIRVWQYFAANVLSNSGVGLLAIAVMFTSAVVFFDITMRGDYLSLLLLTILGTIVLFGVGLAAGGWAKNEAQAAPLANIVAFPMMFLSGVFFPRFLMPEWLQTVSDFLPLTPLVDGFRAIITEGNTILQIAPDVGMLALWGVVVYIIAFKVFRWE